MLDLLNAHAADLSLALVVLGSAAAGHAAFVGGRDYDGVRGRITGPVGAALLLLGVLLQVLDRVL